MATANKLAVLQTIKLRKCVLLGPNSNDITKQKKCDKRKEVTELAKSIGLTVAARSGSDKLILRRLANTAYSSGRHGSVTAWFWAARPGNAIPVPKTYTLLGV